MAEQKETKKTKPQGSKKFVHVQCENCQHTQVVFGRASSKVACSNCGTMLVYPTGGKANIHAQVKELL